MSSFIRLLYHTGTITLAVVVAFVWLRTPSLNHYSLQLFGGVILTYFIIKKLNQADFWQLLPSPASLEMALATLAFLLLIGATGNINSPLFSLSFVHLFFLALSAHKITTVIIMFEIILFHFSLEPGTETIELSYLISLPIVTIIFILAKDQFIKIFKQKASIAQVVNITKTVDAIREIQKVDQILENLLGSVLAHQNVAQVEQLASVQAERAKLTQQLPNEFLSEPEPPAEPLVNLADFSEAQTQSQNEIPAYIPPAKKIEPIALTPDSKIVSERVADEIIDEVSQLQA